MTDSPTVLDVFVQDGWNPRVRPLPATRSWMDATQERFAYRCLPLAIANSHGWSIGSPSGFAAVWDGSTAPAGVTVYPDPGHRGALPVGLFGHGILTFHVEGLFRTSPGWDLWLSAPPNMPKDGIGALSGVVETDWMPFSFTMNWKFTREGHPVRFDVDEPIAALFPVRRGALAQIEPHIRPIADEPDLARRFTEWSRARDDHHRQMAHCPASGSEAWQKHYFHGIDMEGNHASGHLTKLRLRDFRVA